MLDEKLDILLNQSHSKKSPIFITKYKKYFKEAINDKPIEPITTLSQITKTLPYNDNSKIYHNNLHLGQRKLFLTEIMFMNKYYKRLKNKHPIVIYTGAAPSNKTYLLHQLYPDAKFILIDPNAFNLFIKKTGDSHRTRKVRDIVHLYTNKKFKYLGNSVNINREKWVDFIEKTDTYKIFIIEDLMTNELSEILTPLGKKNNMIFLSDIRLSQFRKNSPVDLDFIYDMSIQYNWINIMKPKLWMLKFKMPYYTTDNADIIFKNKNLPHIKEAFEYSKKLGIDFLKNYYDNKFIYLKGGVYIQPWAPPKSTESRLIGIDTNIKEYNISRYENKFFYYNLIQRGFVMHHNNYVDKNMGFDYCNDCSLEAKIWETYVELFNKLNMDVIGYVKILNHILMPIKDSKNSYHGHLLNPFKKECENKECEFLNIIIRNNKNIIEYKKK